MAIVESSFVAGGAAAGASAGGAQMVTLTMMSAAAFGQMLAAFAVTQTNPDLAVWSVTEFRSYCLLGSLGGAFLKVWMFASAKLDDGNNVTVARRLAGEFFASGVCGLLFSPMVFRYMEWVPDVDTVLAVSGAVSFIGLAGVTAGSDKVIEYIKARKTS